MITSNNFFPVHESFKLKLTQPSVLEICLDLPLLLFNIARRQILIFIESILIGLTEKKIPALKFNAFQSSISHSLYVRENLLQTITVFSVWKKNLLHVQKKITSTCFYLINSNGNDCIFRRLHLATNSSIEQHCLSTLLMSLNSFLMRIWNENSRKLDLFRIIFINKTLIKIAPKWPNCTKRYATCDINLCTRINVFMFRYKMFI